jgi:hypothetical protein
MLGIPPRQQASGFIEAVMEWHFRKEYAGSEVEDEGYCSTRLEIANGRVKSIQRYERTVSLKSVQLDARNQIASHVYALEVERSFRTDSTSRDPSPAEPFVQEYAVIARLNRHRDNSYTLVMRPQLKTMRTTKYHLEWKVVPGRKDTTRLRSPIERRQASCDAIDKLQSALQARHSTQGSFRSLRDTTTVNSMFTPVIEANIRGKWDLRP